MRCVICDCCDTAGSLSTPREGPCGKMEWSDLHNGHVCRECLESEEDYVEEEDEEEDD